MAGIISDDISDDTEVVPPDKIFFKIF